MGGSKRNFWLVVLILIAAAILIPEGNALFRGFLGKKPLVWEETKEEAASKNGHDGSPPPESANGHSGSGSGPEDTPRAHVRNVLPYLGYEDPAYGMYTYVLYRWDTTVCTDKTGCEKLKILISYLKNVPGGESMAEEDPATLNSFYIPIKIPRTEEDLVLSMERYSHSKADMILRKFARAVQGKDAELAAHLADDESPGPFLISTLRPIRELGDIQGEFPMLYVDLGDEELECVPEYYKAYKKSLKEQHFGSAEQFKSLELALLDAGLHALRACRIVYGNVLALLGD